MQTSKQRDLVNNPPATREENAFFLEDSQQPQASTSQQPQASTSQQPQASTSQQPQASTSQQPQASTSQKPQASTSQQPQASTSQQPQASTSQQPQASTSQQPQASTSQQPQASTSQQPQASTRQQPQASTRQQPQNPTRQQLQDSTSEPELTEEEEEENTSTALSASHKVGLLRKRQRQVGTQTGARWPRPPLNYCHLIALALKNSPSRGLNVQEIYNFTRQHFPFFQTAPEGWKNTVRHNLCFRGSFEKAPLSPERETTMSRPRSCRWRLTEEGYRRFAEEARALASARFHNIQKSMSQPEMMSILFDL
ncbi:forkhead box protein R1 [Sarcophilus harrisii]